MNLYLTRRIEPNSRTTLIDEQSNPSQLVHQEDVMSRHRGAKQRLRYELFRAISLFKYILSYRYLTLKISISQYCLDYVININTIVYIAGRSCGGYC